MPKRVNPPKKNTQMKKKTVAVAQQQIAKPSKVSSLMSDAGSLLGNFLGGPVGGRVGAGAGSWLSKLTGFGDYKINSNNVANGGAIPSFRGSADGIEICHREFLGDITGSTNFTLAAYPINPGLPQTFPWLSQVAYNFEVYSFKGLVFEFMPSSGSAVSSASSALGKVIYATAYDVDNANFIDKQQMESYEFSTACVPFDKMTHPVECKPRSNVLDNLYVRTGGVPSGQDARFYDMGKFQAATAGMQSSYNVGELWVSYCVRLKRPRLDTTQYGYTHIYSAAAGTATAAAPLGTTGGQISPQSSLVGISCNTSTITFAKAGTYIIAACWRGANIAAAPSFSVGSNITANATLNGFASTGISSYNAGGDNSNVLGVVSVNQDGITSSNVLTLTGNTSMTAANADIMIGGVPYLVGAI